MEQKDWNKSRQIINNIVKEIIKENMSNTTPKCTFCGSTESVKYLEHIDDLICNECEKRVIED